MSNSNNNLSQLDHIVKDKLDKIRKMSERFNKHKTDLQQIKEIINRFIKEGNDQIDQFVEQIRFDAKLALKTKAQMIVNAITNSTIDGKLTELDELLDKHLTLEDKIQKGIFVENKPDSLIEETFLQLQPDSDLFENYSKHLINQGSDIKDSLQQCLNTVSKKIESARQNIRTSISFNNYIEATTNIKLEQVRKFEKASLRTSSDLQRLRIFGIAPGKTPNNLYFVDGLNGKIKELNIITGALH